MFRYSDAAGLTSESTDFVRRKRHGRIWVLCLVYTMLLAFLLSYMFGHGYIDHDRSLVGIVFVIVTGLIAHALYSIQRNLDLIMAVEFQNALFSSAITANAAFTLIMRRDGGAIYADRGFRELFPSIRNVDDNVLDRLVGTFGMDVALRDRLLDALHQRREEKFLVDLHFTENASRYMMTLTPLRRPQGFFMLQARIFVEQRFALPEQEELPPLDPA